MTKDALIKKLRKQVRELKKEIKALEGLYEMERGFSKDWMRQYQTAQAEIGVLRKLPGMHIDDILQGASRMTGASAEAIMALTSMLKRR